MTQERHTPTTPETQDQDMDKNKRTRNIAGTLAAICLMAAALFSFQTNDINFLKGKNMEIFQSVYNELDQLYVDTINPDKSITNAIDGMLSQLDPSTIYYTEEDNEELEMMTKGTYGGIGSLIVKHGDYVAIAEPYVGQPAFEAGLKAGDLILQIDGEEMKGKTNAYVSEKLRGEAGSTFNIKVQRPGQSSPLEFDITRREVQLPVVPYHGIIKDSIGYIQISSFSGNPYPQVREAFIKLKEQGAKSLIIDLRSNGGGLLDQAVKIANLFIPKGKEIVSMRGKTKYSSQTYKTTEEPLDTIIPIAVMVNSQSASASEILAGAIQDLDRGIIVGYRTFGKGLVQNIRPLPYNSTLKLTIAKYYTPSGRCIQALDYSHRNDDGSVSRVPDSLTNVFHTAAGRIVRDGGGIKPDVELTPEKFSNNILFYLITDNLIFDFATDYCLKHETIAQPEEFSITDADYEAFKKKVTDADFKYDRQSEKALQALKEIAEFEGYTESAKAEFESLEKKLSHDLNHDLEHFKKDIVNYINIEITKRYYHQVGGEIQQLKNDKELDKTVETLNDRAAYAKLLTPQNDEETGGETDE